MAACFVSETDCVRIGLLYAAIRYFSVLVGNDRRDAVRKLYSEIKPDRKMKSMLDKHMVGSIVFSPLSIVLDCRGRGHGCTCR